VRKAAQWALSVVLCATPLSACTSIAPKNPVKAAAVCGHAQDPIGGRIADFDLQLVREDQTVIAETRTDEDGNFRFPPVAKGTYYMITKSKGWQLGWSVEVTSSKSFRDCGHPLIAHRASPHAEARLARKDTIPDSKRE
jgi:hypothetical protein